MDISQQFKSKDLSILLYDEQNYNLLHWWALIKMLKFRFFSIINYNVEQNSNQEIRKDHKIDDS